MEINGDTIICGDCAAEAGLKTQSCYLWGAGSPIFCELCGAKDVEKWSALKYLEVEPDVLKK